MMESSSRILRAHLSVIGIAWISEGPDMRGVSVSFQGDRRDLCVHPEMDFSRIGNSTAGKGGSYDWYYVL